VDLRAVQAATGPELAAAAAATSKNACGLLRDAELLAELHRAARAFSLASLAVEEVGKAVSLAKLAGLPEALKAQAPVRRMLEWHQLKQATGQLVAMVPYDARGLAAGLIAMPAADMTRIMSALEAEAEEADRLKRWGLYVDIGLGSRIREPSQITETQVTRQLAQARRAVDSARSLLDPGTVARLPCPPEEGVELARAAVSALGEAGYARTPDAAADVIVNMVSKLRAA